MSRPSVALSACALFLLLCCGGQAVVQPSAPGDAALAEGSTSSSSGGPSSSSGTGPSSSSGSAPDASEDAPACVGHFDGSTRPPPTEHRAGPVVCPANTPTNCVAFADGGGGAACTTDAQCVATDGSYSPYAWCLRGHCAADHCLADSDCPSGQACLCAALQGGNACFHANACVPANCRLDSDCGPGGFCSPDSAACGFGGGIYCHKPTDSCFADSECSCAGGYATTCAYSPAAGAFACAQVTCAG